MIDRQPFTLRELLLYFLRLGTTGFGGPPAVPMARRAAVPGRGGGRGPARPDALQGGAGAAGHRGGRSARHPDRRAVSAMSCRHEPDRDAHGREGDTRREGGRLQAGGRPRDRHGGPRPPPGVVPGRGLYGPHLRQRRVTPEGRGGRCRPPRGGGHLAGGRGQRQLSDGPGCGASSASVPTRTRSPSGCINRAVSPAAPRDS